MKIAMIGLGRMGMNMARRLLNGGHEVVVYNRSPEKTDQLVAQGAIGAYTLSEIAEKLPAPRIIWIMLPAGRAIDDHIDQLKDIIAPGDIIIDGGNTYYKDDIRRSDLLKTKEIRFMDVGVSGGVWGLKLGYCLMIGGDKETCLGTRRGLSLLRPHGGRAFC